jgi:hypothetical protein
MRLNPVRRVAFVFVLAVPVAVQAQSKDASQSTPSYVPRPGALAKENLAKPRPKPAFNLTGTWIINLKRGGYQFRPQPKFQPAAQALYDAGLRANAEGKSFQDDTAFCWPPGMPRVMTRVWPIEMIQLPTEIVMISGLEDQIRWIYLDGRPHADPDLAPLTYNGDSIGHWEADALVIDTTNYETKHHWVEQGIPVSDQFHTIERIRLIDGGNALEDRFTLIDPVNWQGEWTDTKFYNRADDTDITEVHCLPDSNEHLLSTRPEFVVR